MGSQIIERLPLHRRHPTRVGIRQDRRVGAVTPRVWPAQTAIIVLTAFCAAVAPGAVGAAETRAAPPVLDGKAAPAPKAAGTDRRAQQNLYWYDGGRKRLIVPHADKVADFGALAGGAPRIGSGSPALPKTGSGADTSPVFVDATSGQVVGALPGGVIVRTVRAITDRQARDLAESFDTRLTRAVGESGRLWIVEADPGMPSLDMANRIHESGRVEWAAPDWWKPRATK